MNSGQSNRTSQWICLALLLAVAAVYWRVAGFDFVNYDDPDYVTENNMVKGGLTPGGIVWAFTHCYASNWHPLTWISHMLDCQLFGLNPGAHHLVNLALHAANSVLLFLLLQRLTGARWRSAMVAGLFALHPLHVESVAWVAERKDVLSTFFGLLSLLAYERYAKKSTVHSPQSTVWYTCTLALFTLSLMAKPMLVTLPFLLLLLDFWPLQRIENTGWRTFLTPRFGQLFREKWPWFALAAASSAVTFYAQKTGGAILSTEYFPFTWRLANAISSYFEYVLKLCWPAHLAVFYPLAHEQSIWLVLASTVFIVIISSVAIATIKRWPFFLVGWLWFLGTLVPVIGLVQVGSQSMADRYSYIPSIGLFIACVWGAAELLRRTKGANILGAVGGAALVAVFATVTVFQLQFWQNSLTLFNHALAVTHDNAPANNNLATALAALGKEQEALAHYAEAVRIDPNNAHYQNNFGSALVHAGQPDAAADHFLAVVRVEPRFAKAYSNLGALFLAQHRLNEAITNLDEAVKIDPNNGKERNNLGNALSAAGRLDEALMQFSEAVRLDPTNATVRLNAGLALVKANRANDAMVQFAEAVRLNPASAEAHYELGRQLFFQNQFPAAVEQLAAAAKLKPGYALAEFYLAAADAEMGRFDEAITVANQALEAARQAGQTNLATRTQQALEFYKARRPLSQNGANGN